MAPLATSWVKMAANAAVMGDAVSGLPQESIKVDTLILVVDQVVSEYRPSLYFGSYNVLLETAYDLWAKKGFEHTANVQ